MGRSLYVVAMAEIPAELSAEARKIIYRCTHRGTKELDLILGSFARAHVPNMSAEVLAEFQAFTELPEPVLQEILTDKAALPDQLSEELKALLTNFTYVPEGL